MQPGSGTDSRRSQCTRGLSSDQELGLLIGIRVLVGGGHPVEGCLNAAVPWPGTSRAASTFGPRPLLLQLWPLQRLVQLGQLAKEAVKFDLLVILVELGLIFLLMVALLGRLLLAVLLVNLRSCAGELISFAEAERTRRPFALMVPSSSIWLATVNFERSALRAFMSLMHSRPRAETFRIWIRQWSSIAARTPWENGLRFLIFSYSSTERDPFKFS